MKQFRGMLLIMMGFMLVFAGQFMFRVSSQGTPVPGEWRGVIYFGDVAQEASTITFSVDGNGNVTNGQIKIVFTYEGMPPDMLSLMQTYGCVVEFSGLNNSSEGLVQGSFNAVDQSEGTFSTPSCFLQEFGELEFTNPVSGRWEASPVATVEEASVETSGETSEGPGTEAASGTASSTSDRGASLLQFAVETYQVQCTECHGYDAEETNLGPTLKGPTIKRQKNDKLVEILTFGVEDTEMEGYGVQFTEQEKLALIFLMKNWDAVRAGEATRLTDEFLLEGAGGAEAANVDTPTATPEAQAAVPTATPTAAPTTSPTEVAAAPATTSDPASMVAWAWETYQVECTECHGYDAEETNLGPILKGPTINRQKDEKLVEILTYGVEDTEMEGYGVQFTEEEKLALVYLLKNWDAIAAERR